MKSSDDGRGLKVTCTWPLSRSGNWLLRYGICVSLTPAIMLNNSPATWLILPMPGDDGNSLGRDRRIDHHHGGDAKDAASRPNVILEIEIERIVERYIDRVCLGDPEQGVTVRRGVHDRLGGDI